MQIDEQNKSYLLDFSGENVTDWLWDDLLERSQDFLDELANEAHAEHIAGQTEECESQED